MVAGMGFEPHDLRVMRILWRLAFGDSMDFSPILDPVFADVSPTEGRKTLILDFTLWFRHCAVNNCLVGRESVENRLD